MNDTFINKLFEHLEKGNIFIIFVFIAIYIFIYSLKNWKQFLDYYGEHKKSKINAINEALKCEYIDDSTKNHLEELLVTEHFRISTGIKLEKEFREALIKAHKETKGELSFRHFKRALPKIEYSAEKLHIKISWLDKSFCIVNWICALVLIVSAIGICFTMFIHRSEVDWIQILKIIPSIIICFLMAFVALLQTLPIVSAGIIRSYFKEHPLESLMSISSEKIQ